jgi:DNA modification methylase
VAPVGYLETGVIYCDDNLHRLSQFPAACVDLIYLDPPFFSNRHYEVIWGDEAEVRSFEDRWEGGIHVYVEWMRERVLELHRILKPTGTLYLHADWHASHYLKVMLDEVFTQANFRNEIVWERTPAKGHASRKLASNHDVILAYGRTPQAYFQPARRAPSPAYLERFDLDDDDGRGPYRLAPLDNPSVRPNLTYSYKGHEPPARGWRISLPVMEKLDAEGRLAFPKRRGGRIARKHYLADQGWPMLGDVWTDIPPLQAASAERLGYPTQKPEALMERIISMSTRPGDIVLDPFCGCATTLVAAQLLGRSWIGIDISPTAVELEKRRLIKVGAPEVKLVGMPVSEAQLKALKPFEFQNWVIARMNGTHSPRKSGDMGIDGFSFMLHEPIQVKQSSGVGRNVVDNFETAVKRGSKSKGYIVAFSFGKGAHEEAARVKGADGLTIELLTVADLLEGKADLVTPETGLFGADVPLPEPRSPEARPTIEELVASDTGES